MLTETTTTMQEIPTLYFYGLLGVAVISLIVNILLCYFMAAGRDNVVTTVSTDNPKLNDFLTHLKEALMALKDIPGQLEGLAVRTDVIRETIEKWQAKAGAGDAEIEALKAQLAQATADMQAAQNAAAATQAAADNAALTAAAALDAANVQAAAALQASNEKGAADLAALQAQTDADAQQAEISLQRLTAANTALNTTVTTIDQALG